MSDSDIEKILSRLAKLENTVERMATFEGGGIPRTDYTASSTIVGWSSYTYARIVYWVEDTKVSVQFYLSGTSNATSASFTLPYTAGTPQINPIQVPCRTNNNGTIQIGFLSMATGGTVVTLGPDAAGATWSASGNKYALGEFWYEMA